MSSEIPSSVPSDKLPRSEKRQLSEVSGSFMHRLATAVAEIDHVLENSVPDLDTSANAFRQPANIVPAPEAMPAYTEYRPDSHVANEIDPGFASDFSKAQLWDGSLAAVTDDGVEPIQRPIDPRDTYVEYPTEAPTAPNPYAEATSAQEVSMAGTQVDENLRYYEAVQPGGVYDQADSQRQPSVSDIQASLNDIYAQQGGRR